MTFSRTLAFALVALVVAGCSTQKIGGRNPGENLAMPPFPDGEWTPAQTSDGETTVITWTRDGSGDSFVVRVMARLANEPADGFRKSSDEAAAGVCRNLNSQTLEVEPIGGFGRTIWLADCDKEDVGPETVAHLYITGRDAGYYVFRKWAGNPDSASVDSWIEYLRSIGICDTRADRNAPCPAAS